MHPKAFPVALQADYAYYAGMKSTQYTIRGIPAQMDQKLRELAVREGKSLNAEVLDILRKGLGMGQERVRYDDLDDLAGKWVRDPKCEQVLDEMDRIDEELWK